MGRLFLGSDGKEKGIRLTNKKPTAAAAGTITIGDATVNRMGFGAMRITGNGIWGPPKDHDECIRVLQRAVELGVNFIDTADSYGPNVSEELIFEALYPYPEDLVIATKAGLVRPGPGRWIPNGNPDHIRKAIDGSLRRLRLDQIHLIQLHRPDPRVPFEESLGTLNELQASGKVGLVGVSNVSTKQLAIAMQTAGVVSVQNRYNVADRASEAVLEASEEAGVAFLPWRPVGGGDLTGEGSPLAEVAKRHRSTPSQVALAWLLHRSPSMLLMPGTSKVAHLEENVAAAGLQLDDDDVTELDKLGA
jgi:aryl-alcohol dehydrogenase-like predicted oxidoreductase